MQQQRQFSYDGDVVAWADEQAALLRAGRFDLLDIEHLADEIEDVGKSEHRELDSRMVLLVAHLLKWKFQPEKREIGYSWHNTIKTQRFLIVKRLRKTPSLKPSLKDSDWLEEVWVEAVDFAMKETGLPNSKFPESWIWSVEQVLDNGFWPD